MITKEMQLKAIVRTLSNEIDTLEKKLQETELALRSERIKRVSLERAWSIVQDAIVTVRLDTAALDKASAGISALQLNTRANNALHHTGIDTVADLLRVLGPDPESWSMRLRRVRGISRTNAQNIDDALCEYMDVHKLAPVPHAPARVLDPMRQVYVRNKEYRGT